MTEPQFRDLRTARAHYNKESYTVSLNHWSVDVNPLNNVWWINKPDDGFIPTTMHATGVLLTRYQVTKDSDSSWRAEVELGVPETPAGRIRIVSVSITANELDTTALPLTQIAAACLRVGGVLGVFRDTIGERSGFPIRSFSISAPLRDENNELIHPDEIHRLTGQQPPRKRGYRNDPELLQEVWNALNEYQRHKNDRRKNGMGKPDETQNQWVARVCGLPESNVSKQITAARKTHGTTTKNTRGKK